MKTNVETVELIKGVSYTNYVRKVRSAINIVSTYYNIPAKSILGNNRRRSIVEPRHISMYIAYNIARGNVALKDIAAVFSRDHTVIVYAKKSIEDRMSIDKAFKRKVTALIEQVDYELNSSVEALENDILALKDRHNELLSNLELAVSGINDLLSEDLYIEGWRKEKMSKLFVEVGDLKSKLKELPEKMYRLEIVSQELASEE